MESQQAQLDPRPLSLFRAEEHLQEGWRVKRYQPRQLLVLERDREEQWRRVKRQAWAMAAAALVATLLGVGTLRTGGQVGWVSFPLMALFLMVVALGGLSLRQSLRQLREGLGLTVDGTRQVVEGYAQAQSDVRASLSDYAAGWESHPLAQVESVAVRVFPPSGPGVANLQARAEVLVRLSRRPLALVGPLAVSEEGDWEAARNALCPLAAELARVAQCPLRVEYPESKALVELSPAQIAELAPGSPYQRGQV